MIDFWLTVGTFLTDKELWTAVKDANPEYKRIGLTRIWGDGRRDELPWAGEYVPEATERVQEVIDGFFRTRYPEFQIPISAYCAGALCELATSDFKGRTLDAILEIQRAKLPQAVKAAGAAVGRGFRVLAGLVMFDRNARNLVIGGGWPVISDRLYIQLTGEQKVALQAFAQQLTDPTQETDPELGSTWDYGCRQVLFFYGRFPRVFA